MLLFALNATRTFAEEIAATLGVELSAHEEREFEDGEHKARPLVSVRGEDVYVIQSLHGGPDQSPNDKFCRLLFFLATMKENGAARVTAVIPYLAYSRKDRQTKPRDPVTTRYVAKLIEAVGADRVITLDVHNVVAFQNAFRCETVHLDTRRLFAARALALVGDRRVVVASPDPGGVKRAQLFRETIESMLGRPVGGAFMEKRRSAGVVTGNLLIGDVADATVLIVDDLISSGGTMTRAARACREGGAKAAYAFAAHGLFTGDAASALRDPDLAKTFVTDTVPPFRLEKSLVGGRVEIVSAAPLFAETILALHEGNSINALLEGRD
ncbi:ribose-phosphate pyrophosphokinase [Methylocapsa polymorpha]|uniref:Ribose-phosphate pyrophosphokinase n=1 Tax=Methylocapsa polymorpha TaxID=3080828 RepID=A0ABZ0HSC8_9HYPH|nr:ribose-phosphate pyrophosphokinase [Methylocapsa sp. RX1]